MVKRRELWFAAPFEIDIREKTLPALQADELLVQTAVSAISPGTELLLYRGQMPAEMALDETIAALNGAMAYPLQYGYATVGQVVAYGGAIGKAWDGRFVFAFQPHQSHFIAKPAELLPLPAGMSPETAVFLPNMETAVSFAMDGRPIIGERVILFGQGVVGLLTTALLAQFPLAELATVDAYALRREQSRQLGATAIFSPSDPLPANADLVYELSGNPAALDQAIAAAGFNGRVVVGSWYGQKQAHLNLGGLFHRSQISLISSQVSRLRPEWSGRWTKSRRMDTAWAMLQKHKPAQLITHRFPLAEAGDAYQLLDQRAETAVQPILYYP